MINNWDETNIVDPKYFEIVNSGVKKYNGYKQYLSTSSIENDKIIEIEDEIEYENRPSRANMQPSLNTIWFAKMKNTTKVYAFTENNEEEIDKYILSTGFTGVECKKGIYPLFLKQFFLSTYFNDIKDSLSKGSTQKAISNRELKSIQIKIPPLEEQAGIAEILGVVDEAIQWTDAVIAKAEELKRGLMQRLLSRGIGHTEFKQTELGEIPETWKMVRLEDVILDIKYGTSLKSTIKEKGIPILRIPNIIHGKITLDEIKRIEISEKEVANFLLNEGDLLVVRTNANPDYIGRCAPFKGIEGKWIYASYLLRLEPIKEKIDTNYLNYFLTGETGRKQIRKIARTSAGNYNINIPSLLSLKMALPDYTEQMKISNGLSNLDEKIELEVLKKTKLESLKINLMQVLYSGRVRVRLDEGGLHRVGDG